jgi:hypothetical protein
MAVASVIPTGVASVIPTGVASVIPSAGEREGSPSCLRRGSLAVSTARDDKGAAAREHTTGFSPSEAGLKPVLPYFLPITSAPRGPGWLTKRCGNMMLGSLSRSIPTSCETTPSIASFQPGSGGTIVPSAHCAPRTKSFGFGSALTPNMKRFSKFAERRAASREQACSSQPPDFLTSQLVTASARPSRWLTSRASAP